MKYLIEGCLLLLIWFFGSQAIDAYFLSKNLQQELLLKRQLQGMATELSLETLSAMDRNVYHFDRHAQKQLELERLINELELNTRLNSEIKQSLDEFKNTIDTYMQLASMLKTSYRYIAKLELSKAEFNQEAQVLISRSIALVSNLHVTNSIPVIETVNNQLVLLVPELKLLESQAPRLRVLRLHIEFVLDNALKASNLLVPIQESEVVKTILHNVHGVSESIEATKWLMVRAVFMLICAIFLLIIIALSRLLVGLKKANILANQAAETKSLFVSNMSHEIRTPMNGILGLTDILLSTELTSVQRNYLEKVRFSANALTTIINDILDFSKIESKKLHIEHIPFQFEDLLDNLRSLITPLANTKDVKLIFDLAPNISKQYIGDPVRINQIMLNFASNAVKFTEHGSITLSVKQEEYEDDKVWVVISIADTGIGIAQESVDQLFERFTQAESSTTRKYGGTGLGLTICKLLTELMSGEIQVESELGKGSKFTVRLPLALVTEKEVVKPKSISGSMLIVEDDPIYLEISQNISRSIGLQVSGVTNGRDAQTTLANQTFDILLVDWVLPDCQANELLKILQAQGSLPQRVVIYTAHTQESIDTESGFPILYKPLLKRDLIDALSSKKPPQLSTTVAQDGTINIPVESNAPAQQSENILGGIDLRVLLVEDNDINRIVALKLLDRIPGIDVQVAENGKIAVDKINQAQGKFDIVFMDIQMPVMDGVEATKLIREAFSPEQLKIVALTANVMQSEVDKYLEVGMNGHLGKPFKMDELEAVFKQHMAELNLE
ncbi:hybrid sensor histidine kinase/response regulator [Pseudoalteromonas luteoviolacea]|uniref:hybrid sensor histidine kinase/response regulator n=1 Tax=Pseudoalteromonas luteoviolacea TaxID=43657 RepID=UPI001B372825|nr:response regulator [Pseudoalteromonas luteoviolacea]